MAPRTPATVVAVDAVGDAYRMLRSHCLKDGQLDGDEARLLLQLERVKLAAARADLNRKLEHMWGDQGEISAWGQRMVRELDAEEVRLALLMNEAKPEQVLALASADDAAE